MRQRIIQIFVVIGLLCLCSSQTFAQGKKWALLVGVEEYDSPDISHLDFAVKDVSAVAGVLHDRLGYQTRLMTSAVREAGDPNRPTNLNVFKVLDRLAQDIKEEDTFVFYFSGHGFNKDGQNFLGSVNTDAATVETLELSAITLANLQKKVQKLKARQVIFIMDACRNDPEKGKGNNDNKLTNAFSKSLIAAARGQGAQAGGSAVFFACSEGERAFEDSKREQSAFTYYLLEALRGKAETSGTLTMTDVADYVQRKVGEWARDNNKQQTPELKTEGAARILLADKIAVGPNHALPTEPKEPGVVPANGRNPKEGADKVFTPTRVSHLDAKYGMDLVTIPAGEFIMGSTEAEIDALLRSDRRLQREWFVGEFPQHKVYLDTYYIMKTPVTVKQYLAFCAATGHRKPPTPNFNSNWSQQNHPIVNVSWNDAMDYCAWLSKETGHQVRLPTEAQWEKAARGESGLTFPWGNTFDSNRLQCSRQTIGDAHGTAPIGSFPSGESPYGVLDMAGNVSEWCWDWYDENYYRSSPLRNPTGPPSGQRRVMRGGSWDHILAGNVRCTNRDMCAPDSIIFRNSDFGFRCVVSADSP